MIVCVEDELNIQELIVYTLNSTGYKATGVSNGVQLDEFLKLQIPELILLDLMLPDESGLEILKRLRENKRTKDIPVIILNRWLDCATKT